MGQPIGHGRNDDAPEQRAIVRAAALAKLTPEERAALGVS